jgi:hypothetical protein
MKNIIFHSNVISERGVCVAIYDYAFYGRKYLNLNPIIVYDLKSDNYQSSVDHFKKEFDVIGYENFEEVQRIVDDRNIEYFYAQKYGVNDGIQVRNAKNLIHSVFSRDLSQVHGDVYAFISEWMSSTLDYQIPFVPYMINLPNHEEDMRSELNIPLQDLVIGRYGGYDTFNIEFAWECISEALEKRKDLWFIFYNTPQIIQHERCLYFDCIVDQNSKVKYINTCDAFLHARDYGETFGAAILEFACKNKQIISYDDLELQNLHPLGGRNHFMYLNNNCHKYKNKNNLYNILLNIGKNNPFNTLYLNEEFSPQRVITIFENVFLK